ncbi:MAG: ATP synthase F1 subunit delta [Phycisphaeraceae bacterium]|nr:ATP synthase F1 subunit delta [Phycisphaeraceae bacterium]
MPMTENAPDAVSRVYATSLFELAQQQGGQARVEELLAELEDIIELTRQDPRFGEFIASRIVPAEGRAEGLRRIFAGRISDVTLNFLLVLNHKDRLGHLAQIVSAYDQITQHAFGRIEVDVFTPSPIGPDELAAIRDRLRAVLSREPVVHPYTDPKMIGGLRLQIGDQLIDASISTRLRKLHEQLTERGSATLRGRFDRIFDEHNNGN